MRVALIGYGAVAVIHSRRLAGYAKLISVFGPDETKARTFAQAHEIPNAYVDLERALAGSDAAIICSPSALHFEQAKAALEAGVHVLVELPACVSVAEAETLSAVARSRRLVLQCAHTSRYAEPYRRVSEWIKTGALGEIRHVHYIRCIPPRKRSWTDDALLHHAEHPLDLFLHWFGFIKPLGCAAYPCIPGAQDLSLIASVCNNVPVSVSISYTSRLPEVKMTLIGTEHTIATDGFTYIAADEPGFTWQGDERQVYESAIQKQDISFLNACRDGQGGVPWHETVKLTNCISEFANLWNR